MVFLLDFLSVVVSLLVTAMLFTLYYRIFIHGYFKRIKQAEENGESEKAEKMKALAIKRQPKRMKRLQGKYGIQ